MSLHFVNEYAEKFSDLVSEQGIAADGQSTPRLFNQALWQQLGGEPIRAETLTARLDGEQQWPGIRPLAQKYAGHQFGHFNPYLGDGRGLLLGEVKTPTGEFYDLHLKGAGPTPYGRGGDGRAVLRSSIREYLASEAFAALGIPTTRALLLTSTEGQIQRERIEPGAMLLRVAKTHVRFGHFEHCYYRRLPQQQRQLWDYVIARQWPELSGATPTAQFRRVTERTALMIALWQAYGFIHGVMNTDNMSLLGETFDYGPYAMFDSYQPEKIFNHTDQGGRYSFTRQPGIGRWNLQRLQVALSASMDVTEFTSVIDEYEPLIQTFYFQQMRQRLGLTQVEPGLARELIAGWLQLLEAHQLDYNRSFIELERYVTESAASELSVVGEAWLRQYLDAVNEAPDIAAMQQVNPVVTLRTHLLSEVISAAEQGDDAPLTSYLEALERPFQRCLWGSHWAQPPAEEIAPGSLSCSS